MRSAKKINLGTVASSVATMAVCWAGSAQAQSCVQESAATTVCRVLLSRPRTFTVQAAAKYVAHRPAPAAGVRISVDGRACSAARFRISHITGGQCRVLLPVGMSVIEAQIDDPAGASKGVGVALVPDGRLASLPREAGDLYPPRGRGGFLRRLWPLAW